MAFAGGGLNQPSARELAPGPRFFLCVLASLVLMYFDQKDGWGDRIRYGLQAAAYPIQVTIGSPRMMWGAASDFFQSRSSLREENEALERQVRELSLRSMRLEALDQENTRLRALVQAPPPLVKETQLVQVVNEDLGRLRQRLTINAGHDAGLFRSQTIIDSRGLIGQLSQVGPWSSEVMLITDPEAAVPVEVVRSGVRTLAMGTGRDDVIDLPLLPATADVRVGDKLVTSGLGSVFPAGIPVGTIIESRREPDKLLAFASARPAARLAASRQLLALWFEPSHPAAPADSRLLDALPEAPKAQPVTTPPAQRAAPAAPPPGAAAPTPPASRRPGPR
jgi:rod shape-determining protein MreC